MMLHHANHLALIVTISCLWTIGCSQSDSDVSESNNTPEASDANPQANELSTENAVPRNNGPNEDDYPALLNLLQVTDKIYSGGKPHGNDAFASLARLGVKTVVSVDGAKPDVETARRHGLQYVHIPIGYDGVGKEAGRSLARLVRDADSPFYVHCHHGRHRAPAAAAVACIASGIADGKQALNILERAGTSKGYAGLWRDVENYQIPVEFIELPALVEIAEVGSFAAAMVQIDRACNNLKLCREARWSNPNDHPDLVPAQEALLLKEGLRESARNLADTFCDEFRIWLTDAESIAQELEESLNANKKVDELSNQFQVLEASCKKCHNKYRN